MSYHGLPACGFWQEVWCISYLYSSVFNVGFFSSGCCQDFSFSLIFSSSNMMSLDLWMGLLFIWFIIWVFVVNIAQYLFCLGFFQIWTFGLLSFMIFGKFSVTISSNISSALFSTFFSWWDTSYIYVSLFDIVPEFLKAEFFFSLLFVFQFESFLMTYFSGSQIITSAVSRLLMILTKEFLSLMLGFSFIEFLFHSFLQFPCIY